MSGATGEYEWSACSTRVTRPGERSQRRGGDRRHARTLTTLKRTPLEDQPDQFVLRNRAAGERDRSGAWSCEGDVLPLRLPGRNDQDTTRWDRSPSLSSPKTFRSRPYPLLVIGETSATATAADFGALPRVSVGSSRGLKDYETNRPRREQARKSRAWRSRNQSPKRIGARAESLWRRERREASHRVVS